MPTWGEIISSVFNSSTSRLKVETGGTVAATGGSTAAVTSVNDSATSVTLLSANTAATERIIQNRSTVAMYVRLGAAAAVVASDYEILPNGYFITTFTGEMRAIWASDASGHARITEITA